MTLENELAEDLFLSIDLNLNKDRIEKNYVEYLFHIKVRMKDYDLKLYNQVMKEYNLYFGNEE